MSHTYAGRATARFEPGIDKDTEPTAPRPSATLSHDPKPSLPRALSWAIVTALAVIIIGMLFTPFVGQGIRFIPALAAAGGFFALFALVKRASTIRAG